MCFKIWLPNGLPLLVTHGKKMSTKSQGQAKHDLNDQQDQKSFK